MDDPNTNPEQMTPEDAAYVEEFNKGLETPPETEPLLAGKYKDVAALEKGYLELQKKYSGPKAKEETPDPETVVPEDASLEFGKKTEPEAEIPEARPLVEYLQESASTGEALSDEDRATIKAAYRLDDATIDTMMQAAHVNYENSVREVINACGGKEQLDALNVWVQETFTDAQIADINKAMLNDTLRLATVQGLMSRMQSSYNAPQANKPTPSNLPTAPKGAFKSDAELQAAMADERYTNVDHADHVAYVQEVQARYAASTHLH